MLYTALILVNRILGLKNGIHGNSFIPRFDSRMNLLFSSEKTAVHLRREVMTEKDSKEVQNAYVGDDEINSGKL